MGGSGWLSLTDAARELRLSYGQTLRLVLLGTLESRRVERHWEVAAESIRRHQASLERVANRIHA